MNGESIFGLVMCVLLSAASGQYFQWRFKSAREDARAWEAVADHACFERDEFKRRLLTLCWHIDSHDPASLAAAREEASRCLAEFKLKELEV